MAKRKGQSTLEYVIVVTAIVGAILAWAATLTKPPTGTPTQGLQKLMYRVGEKIKDDSHKIITEIAP